MTAMPIQIMKMESVKSFVDATTNKIASAPLSINERPQVRASSIASTLVFFILRIYRTLAHFQIRLTPYGVSRMTAQKVRAIPYVN